MESAQDCEWCGAEDVPTLYYETIEPGDADDPDRDPRTVEGETMSDGNVIDLSDYRVPTEKPLPWELVVRLPDAGSLTLTEQDIEALKWASRKLEDRLTMLRRKEAGTWETAVYDESEPAWPEVGEEYIYLGALEHHGARIIMRCEKVYTSPRGRNKGAQIVVLTPVSISRYASRFFWQDNRPKPREERLLVEDFTKTYRRLREHDQPREALSSGSCLPRDTDRPRGTE